MEKIIYAIYNAGFAVWNSLIKIAMTLFKTSPTNASGGGLYSTAHEVYNTIIGVATPIACCFFIIAIYKSVISTPPERQPQRFLQDSIRYIIMLYVIDNSWTIMGYIMQFCDGITKGLASSYTKLKLSKEMKTVIKETVTVDWDDFSILDIGGSLKNVFSGITSSIVFVIASILGMLIIVACALSIINCAFQRIIKPLILLPFTGIAIGIGACQGEGTRTMWHFIKSFFAMGITGAFMVLAIKFGYALTSSVITSDLLSGSSGVEKAILTSLQMMITPIIIAGLVKSSDSVVQRAFG